MSRCTDSKIGRLLHEYELGHLKGDQLDLFEHHLLTCQHCFSSATDFDEAAELLRSDGEVRNLVSQLDREARNQVSLLARLKTWLWPETSLFLRPAFIYAVLALLIYPAYLGFGPSDVSEVSPVSTIWLTSTRTVTSTADIGAEPLVLVFRVDAFSPGRVFAITVASEQGEVVYSEDRFGQIDERKMGTLLFASGILAPGTYHLQIEDRSSDEPPQSYTFSVR